MLDASSITTTMYIAHLSAGLIVPDESTTQIEARDPQLHARLASANVFAFFYFDTTHTTANVNGRDVAMTSDRHSISTKYYIDGNVLTIDEVRDMDDSVELLKTMKSNGFRAVVELRTGRMLPFDPDKDATISSK